MGSSGGGLDKETKQAQESQAVLQQQQLELEKLAAESLSNELVLLNSQLQEQGKLYEAQNFALDLIAKNVRQGELDLSNLLVTAADQQRLQSQQVASEATRAKSAEKEQSESLLDMLGLVNATRMNNR